MTPVNAYVDGDGAGGDASGGTVADAVAVDVNDAPSVNVTLAWTVAA
jgi:hypothetical protein